MIPDTYRIKKTNKYISMHRTKMKFCAQIPHNGPISHVISPLIALILIDSLFLSSKVSVYSAFTINVLLFIRNEKTVSTNSTKIAKFKLKSKVTIAMSLLLPKTF